jgi:hypothetical protein
LGSILLTHELGNARAKGKLERWNRFFQERVLADGPLRREVRTGVPAGRADILAAARKRSFYLAYYTVRLTRSKR